MLGEEIDDPEGMESGGSEMGLGLLSLQTVLGGDKQLVRREYFGCNWWKGISCTAYEIHLGRSCFKGTSQMSLIEEDDTLAVIDPEIKVLGTYLHGLLESSEIVRRLLHRISGEFFDLPESFEATKEQELDSLADFLEKHCEVEKMLGI